ncbi:Abortive infection protein [Prochlorococcus marinus str. MIT 9515]|uniref:Abortive infection protein n=2 Tax=Prochlorococcus marinus TaxID=1219 RepID=A2BUY7_PROM5|nr:Abortive infection protein [Prochlorococcus marinus str. MIT 9515]
MFYILNSIKTIYEKFLLIKPRILTIILFMPCLYLLGWLLANPLLFTGVGEDKISLIGTIITFLLFITAMPKWFEIRWGLNDTWMLLGINKIDKKPERFIYFLRGLLYAFILLSLILIPIISNEWGNWLGRLSPEILLNSLVLIIGIGFAEELIFRGWLLEELKNQYGFKKACIIQSLVFSMAHTGFDMPFWQMISILFGLFLLGILLSIIRIKDDNSLWGCAGMHGGLVGIWFLMNNGLVEISLDAPNWLIGPGYINTNPLGGFYGISLLIITLFYNFFKYKKKISKFITISQE